MYRYDYVDMVGGLLLTFMGMAVAYTAIEFYPMGSIARMGPGMFPAGLGGILAVLGFALVVQSLRRPGERPDLRIFSPIFVLSSVAAFAVIMPYFGLIPAIVAVCVISSLAELKFRAVSVAMLAATMTVLCALVFRIGLSLPIPLVRWPL